MLYVDQRNTIESLLSDIKNGRLGLPYLQRPFVWKNEKVRKLYESLIKGFPIGCIMVWNKRSSASDDQDIRTIGTNPKNESVKDLIIDGQQRLTALYSTIYGVDILDENYKTRRIKISYNPITKKLDNWSASKEKDNRYIADISDIFNAYRQLTLPSYIDNYIENLNNYRQKNHEPELSDQDRVSITNNINDILRILQTPIVSINITQDADDEDVAEIFVRVNSGGQTLTQDDFVSTLLSVYSKDLRKQMEDFCKESRDPQKGTSYNNLIDFEMGHIIRITAALAFKRARMNYIFKMMDGVDLETKTRSVGLRDKNLNKFANALQSVINLNELKSFLYAVTSAGFIDKRLISSKSTIIYSYALYLIARSDFKMTTSELLPIFTAWFFAASTSSFYLKGTTETTAEQQLTYVKNMNTKQEFINFMKKSISDLLTEDFFNSELKNKLFELGSQGPYWNGYVASQIILGYKVLFSTESVEKMFTPGTSGKRAFYDYHHIFPKAFLKNCGYAKKDYDKRANFTILDNPTNKDISDKDPHLYMAEYKEKLNKNAPKDVFAENLKQNAIPANVADMTFEEFVEARADLMVDLVRDAYNRIKLS